MVSAAIQRELLTNPRESQCSGKREYPDFNAADKAARNLRRATDEKASPYKCRLCLRWHVGTHEVGRGKRNLFHRGKTRKAR